MFKPQVRACRYGRRAYSTYVAVRPPVVLIIADDPIAREVYAELFAMRGYRAVTTGGTREALELACGRDVTAVVLALAARRGSRAAQLRRRLRAVRPRLRVHVTGLPAVGLDPVPTRQQLH